MPATSFVSFPVVVFIIATNIAVFFALPALFGNLYRFRREELGAVWGPLIFDGQWWRLFTCDFVHFDLLHLCSNMLGVWILGKRMERELGSWLFLFLYLSCGLAVSLTVLTLRPDVVSFGSSGCVLGLAGGLIAIYGARFRLLQWGTRAKLGALSLYVAGLVWREFSRGGLYIPHTTGMIAGALFGSVLWYGSKTTRGKCWTISGIAMLLVIAVFAIRQYHT
jgi:rhomboid protease GluP